MCVEMSVYVYMSVYACNMSVYACNMSVYMSRDRVRVSVVFFHYYG